MNGTYVVLTAVLVIWIGIFLYLVSLDRKVRALDAKLDRLQREKP